jgi:hypothetical protein
MPSVSRPAVVFLLLTALGGSTSCALRSRSGPDPIAVQVSVVDATWAQRDAASMERVRRMLREANAISPGDPQVAWRLARLYVATGQGQVEHRRRIEDFASARAVSMGCIQASGPFTQRRAQLGWELALAEVGSEESGCVVWAAYGWARWFAEYGGAAAAMDLPALTALVSRARELEPTDPVVDWAEALVVGTRGDDRADPGRAYELLESVAQRTGELGPWVDVVLHVAGPTGDLTLEKRARLALEASEPRLPEDPVLLQRVVDGE